MPNEAITAPAIEERPFVIGPLPPGEEDFIPPSIKANLARVGEPGFDENELHIRVPGVTAVISALVSEIDGYLQRCLMSGILTERQCSDAMDRMTEAGRGGGLEKDLPTLRDVYKRVVHSISTQVCTALIEAFANHDEHGNKDPSKTIEGKYWMDADGHFHTWSFDHGQGFDPDTVRDPTGEAFLELSFGRGLLLEKTFMDNVEYGSQGTSGKMGTSLHMTKLTGNLSSRMVEANPDHKPEDAEQDGVAELALDRYVRHAMHGILSERKRDESAEAQREAQSAKNREVRTAWFGTKHKLITWLQGEWTVREHLAATAANLGKKLIPKPKKSETEE